MPECLDSVRTCSLCSASDMGITSSILGYSLLYPYSDNYLDRADISAEEKLRFSERFRDRLRGEGSQPQDVS